MGHSIDHSDKSGYVGTVASLSRSYKRVRAGELRTIFPQLPQQWSSFCKSLQVPEQSVFPDGHLHCPL
jgi:hypothetical protein